MIGDVIWLCCPSFTLQPLTAYLYLEKGDWKKMGSILFMSFVCFVNCFFFTVYLSIFITINIEAGWKTAQIILNDCLKDKASNISCFLLLFTFYSDSCVTFVSSSHSYDNHPRLCHSYICCSML